MSSTVTTPPATMKACIIPKLGDPSVLTIQTQHPTPPLQPNHVIVRNQYAGLNFIDTYHRTGLYPRTTPFIPGGEGGGLIAAVSPEAEASGLSVGQAVVHMSPGSYAEYVSVPAARCIPVPDGIAMDVAVACMVQGLTAHYLTASAHAGLVKEGEWVLIYSVGSGTCQWAAQMAKIRGFRVIGTTSRSKADVAARVGCDELIVLDEVPGAGLTYADYDSVDIAGRVAEITGGEGCRCVIDGVGASTWEISLASLSRRGIFVSFGNASGAVPAFPVLRLNAKSAFVTRPKLGDYIADAREMSERCEDVFRWIKEGKLSVGIDTKFPLESVVDGHKYLESGRSKGKILFTI